MDNLKSSLTKPTGIINTETFRNLGRRRARGSEFKEAGQRLKAQRTQGFKEAMEAADDLIIDKSARHNYKNRFISRSFTKFKIRICSRHHG